MRTDKQEKIYRKLKRNKNKVLIRNSYINFTMVLENDENLNVRLNLIDDNFEWVSLPPWRADENGSMSLTNRDREDLANYFQDVYELDGNASTSIQRALRKVAEANKYNPIKDYLTSTKWDGVERAATFFINYLGAPDTDLTRELTFLWLLGAVKRIYQPGCKMNYLLVLQGPQGIGKSTLLSKLGVKWFTDSFKFSELRDKTAIEKIYRKWIVNADEMTGLGQAKHEQVLNFITQEVDYFRLPYARVPEEHRRQFVICGTTNEAAFLSNPNGNRRYWPLRCDPTRATKDVFSLSEADIAQVWAEVYAAYLANPEVVIDVTDPELKEELKELQASVTYCDEREGLIANFLDIRRPDNWDKLTEADRVSYIRTYTDKRTGTPPQEITLMEIHVECLGRNRAELTSRESREYRRMVESLGWVRQEKKKRHPVYGPQYFYNRNISKLVESLEHKKIA